jgi:hypothetical protein
MKPYRKQIHDFLDSHDFEPTDLFAHDATIEIKTAYEWAKIFLLKNSNAAKPKKYGFFNQRDFGKLQKVTENSLVGRTTNGTMILLDGCFGL